MEERRPSVSHQEEESSRRKEGRIDQKASLQKRQGRTSIGEFDSGSLKREARNWVSTRVQVNRRLCGASKKKKGRIEMTRGERVNDKGARRGPLSKRKPPTGFRVGQTSEPMKSQDGNRQRVKRKNRKRTRREPPHHPYGASRKNPRGSRRGRRRNRVQESSGFGTTFLAPYSENFSAKKRGYSTRKGKKTREAKNKKTEAKRPGPVFKRFAGTATHALR